MRSFETKNRYPVCPNQYNCVLWIIMIVEQKVYACFDGFHNVIYFLVMLLGPQQMT